MKAVRRRPSGRQASARLNGSLSRESAFTVHVAPSHGPISPSAPTGRRQSWSANRVASSSSEAGAGSPEGTGQLAASASTSWPA